MADDIDIEEHDPLDNPKIKNIFPDILSIKTEVIDPVDEEIEENFTLNYEDDAPVETDENNLYQNKIILGSKPNSSTCGTNTPEPHIQETSIVVTESGLHLENNPCYCEDCKILFPTENALDSHKSTAHSFLAVRRNKAVKSTTKGSLFARKIKLEPDSVEYQSVLCHHCNEVFPNEIALIKHSYELLPGSFKCDLCDLEFENDAALKIHQTNHSMIDKYVCCPICTCHFRNKDKLAAHMGMFHEFVEDIQSPSVVVDFKCENCDNVLPDCKRYNQHIQHVHPDLYNKVVSEDCDKYKCLSCNLTFPSAYSEKIHRAAHHAKNEMDSLNRRAIEESEPFPSTSAVDEYETNFVPMPISTLFKCTKCQINFISITKAVEHFEICEYRKGDFKCQICRRFVNKSDKMYHLKQHEIAERLKSIKVRDVNILNRIICMCRKCQVCYDEQGFQKCHEEDCIPRKNVECSLCGLVIDEDYMVQHSNAHATGVKTIDFIEVDYISFNTIKTKSPEMEIPKMDRAPKLKHLYYCPSCKCYLKINRSSHGHSDGTCNRINGSYLCKLCGLRFTAKGIQTHKREHKKCPNLKMRDMKFTNAQTGKRIDPPFPIFKKCKDCKVHFFGDVARRRHVCYSEDHKNCDYCTEKFSDLAFKLHVPFHKYAKHDKKIVEKTSNIPEILKTYESLQTIWNILYLCETCDTIIDTYDTVVEHCQDHFCNMESYNTTINNCNKCKLKFVGNSFDRHKELHTENDINKDSFIILNFNYEKLLTNEWSKTFDSLAKEQVLQILSKSIYQFTRNIRMEIVVDGPLHLTLYKCGICNTVVESTSVVEHAQNNSCANHSSRYNCVKCNLCFSGRFMKSEHEKLHETRKLNSKSYRIIVFNSEKDAYVNDVLRSKLRPAGLHFKRCQQCGKLIKKEKFQKHYLHHIYYQKVKMRKKQPKLLARSNLGRMTHTFYTCKQCKISVIFKHTVSVHYCNDSVKLTKCSKCSLMIRASCLRSHLNYHDKYPKMTRSDINIVYFHNKKNNTNFSILDRTENNELVLYQCVRCSISVHREANIKLHNCSTKLNRKTCNLCEMPFHSAHIAYHKRLHDQISFSKAQIVIIKFKDGIILNNVSEINSKFNKIDYEQSVLKRKTDSQYRKPRPYIRKGYEINHELSDREFYRSLSCRLFKCFNCKLLFITGSALVEHQKICSEDNEAVECKGCGLIFHYSMIKLHMNLQKCNFKPNINIIYLKSVGDTNYYKNVVYLCQECDVYNISLRGIEYHLSTNHKIGQRLMKCTICDISFSSVSYVKHKKLHHYKKNITLDDLVVATVDVMTLQKALENLPNENEIRLINLEDVLDIDTVDNDRQLKRKLSIDDDEEESEQVKTDESDVTPLTTPKSKVAFDKSSLYTCDICDLNFLHPKSLKRHMDIGRHDEQRMNCTECNLMFTKMSLTRHMNIHKTFGKNKEPMYRPKYRNNYRKSQDDSIEMEDSLQSTSRDRPIVVQETSRNSVQIVQESTSTERVDRSEQSNTKVELYKCGGCDVYYLRDDICRDHITNHTPLDPTEYIACKMCDLQFLCEYLGSHMRTHRDKTFNIDNLIVKEYQISNRIEITVDTYSAGDRLKSKLVSTTTHFDMEDEKNAIDSTTDPVDRLDVVSLNSNQSGTRSNSQMEVDS